MNSPIKPIVALWSLYWILNSTSLAASRTDENTVTAAEDAFGTSIGRESIGIYSSDSVRGFSPTAAGNLRIEGLYFDAQSNLSGRLLSSATIHVGPSAQSYPFPAPTGVVDFSLLDIGENARDASVVVSREPYGGTAVQLETQVSTITGSGRISAGIAKYDDRFADGGKGRSLSMGVVPRLTLSNSAEIIGFWGRLKNIDQNPTPVYLPEETSLPPEVPRGRWPGPYWAEDNNTSDNGGLIFRITPEKWSFNAGVFRSEYDASSGFANLFYDVSKNGSATRYVIAGPPTKATSTSGEVILSREWGSNRLTSLLRGSYRWRSVRRDYGGDDVVGGEVTQVGDTLYLPKPVFQFGEQTLESINQNTAALSYGLRIGKIADFAIGALFTDYLKKENHPNGATGYLKTRTPLPNATLTLNVTPRVALYGSFVKGLEDSSSAPDTAINRGEPSPALKTKQYDLGFRLSLSESSNIIAGGFEVTKPYLSTDSNNVYRQLGEEIHRGVELSLSSSPYEGLTVLFGGYLVDNLVRQSGDASDNVGKRPVGQPDKLLQLNFDYVVPFIKEISLDASVTHTGKQAGTLDNTVSIPNFTTINIGARYMTKFQKYPLTLRILVENVTDTYSWQLVSSGAYVPTDQRTFSAYVAVDFQLGSSK